MNVDVRIKKLWNDVMGFHISQMHKAFEGRTITSQVIESHNTTECGKLKDKLDNQNY